MNIDEFKTEIEEIRSQLEQANSAEEIDALNARMDELEARKAEVIAEAKAEAEKRAAIADGEIETKSLDIEIPKEESNMKTLDEIRSSQEYLDAYANYFKTGSDREVRSLLTELAEDYGGTVPVPTLVSDLIATNWTKLGIASRCSEMFVPGLVVVPYEGRASGASVHEEGGDAPDEEFLEIGKITLIPQTIKKWLKVSDEALTMSSADLMRYVVDEITYRIMLNIDNDVVYKIANTIDSALVADVYKDLNWDSVFAGLGLLGDEAGTPVAIMNRATFFNGFLALADQNERPIYDIVSQNGAPTYYINGVEVLFSSELSSYEDASDGERWLIVGDLKGYTNNYPDGRDVKIITDPYSLAEYDLVKVVGSCKVAGAITKPGCFAALKKGSDES